MTSDIDYGSFCTGYDGIGLGLRLAGLPLAHRWMSETESSVARVLKREHDGVPNVGDLKTAPWHLAPRTQLVSSGDPCQSISIAGRQAGREDPRFLWPWVRAAYREVRPPFLFFENVANIVSHDSGRTLAERFQHLREDGYAVRWTVLGACAVGAPHHRHRWYALAAQVGASAPEAVRVGGGKAICGAPVTGGRRVMPTPNARDGGTRGTPSAEHAARRLADPMRSLNLEDAVALLPTPTASSYGNNQGGGAGRVGPVRHSLEKIAPDPELWGRYAEAVALWEAVTGIPAPDPTEVTPTGARRMSAALPEWMMGLRPGLLTGELNRTEALTAAGNGCVPQAVAAAYRLLSAPS
jgi:DNA (cytosine-5)-methyltransferase 1